MHKVSSARIRKKLVTVASREKNLGVKGQDGKMAGYSYPLFKRKKITLSRRKQIYVTDKNWFLILVK